MLVGTNDGVVRINVGGRIERIYRGYRQIALDVDRHSFWTAGADDRALKIDLITGNIVASTNAATGPAGLPATSITVVDEPRAAMGDALGWTLQLPTTNDTMTIGLEGWNSWCSHLGSVTVSDGVVTLSLQGAACGTPTFLQSSYAIGRLPAGHYLLKVIREGVPIGDAELDVTVPVPAIGTATAILLCAALITIAWLMLRPG